MVKVLPTYPMEISMMATMPVERGMDRYGYGMVCIISLLRTVWSNKLVLAYYFLGMHLTSISGITCLVL